MRGCYRYYLIVSALVVGVILIMWYMGGFVASAEDIPYSWNGSEKITLHRGDTPYLVVDKLNSEHPDIDKSLLLWLMEKYHVSKNFKAGYIYCIPKEGTYLDIVMAFQDWCDKAFVMVTFPEGITIKDMANILYKKTGTATSMFIRESENKALLARISDFVGQKVSSSEGFLYPDTYAFTGSVSLLVNEMFDNFLKKTAHIDWQKAEKKTGLNRYEIITLASIVEKEAVKKEEAPIIAGVFINRLRRHMKLESCPTVEYALGIHKPVLSYKDIQVDSPYNTYRYYGLPPTPIGNPSISSIMATINYAHTDYLYFVADGKGGHLFAKTYKEHLANIRRVESGK